MINLSMGCVFDNVWRNLADISHPGTANFADLRCAVVLFNSFRRSGLLANHRGRLRDLAGTKAADGCQHQQGEAADDRIEQQRHPDRHRHRNRATRGHKANHRGYQYQTCEHFLQPPREEHHQRASVAWQDCGRPWENLRRINLTVGRLGWRWGTGIDLVTLRRLPRTKEQRKVARRLRGCGVDSRPLKTKGNMSDCAMDVRSPVLLLAWDWLRRHQAAAIWHKTGIPESLHTPELTDDCLSFVIPDQQGARVASFEDVH